jgi:hypothetical protein
MTVLLFFLFIGLGFIAFIVFVALAPSESGTLCAKGSLLDPEAPCVTELATAPWYSAVFPYVALIILFILTYILVCLARGSRFKGRRG